MMKVRRGIVFMAIMALLTAAGQPAMADEPQRFMTFEEYLQKGGEAWFLTGKRAYAVQAMMVSREIRFQNALEAVDYTVADDGESVVLKGTAGEMWVSALSRVMSTYTKPDGVPVDESDFREKDVYIDLVSIPSPNSCYAMRVPKSVSVTVETGGSDVLHTNLPGAPHGEGDYLVCRVGRDGEPDLSDVWVLNGLMFQRNYDAGETAEGGVIQ